MQHISINLTDMSSNYSHCLLGECSRLKSNKICYISDSAKSLSKKFNVNFPSYKREINRSAIMPRHVYMIVFPSIYNVTGVLIVNFRLNRKKISFRNKKTEWFRLIALPHFPLSTATTICASY